MRVLQFGPLTDHLLAYPRKGVVADDVRVAIVVEVRVDEIVGDQEVGVISANVSYELGCALGRYASGCGRFCDSVSLLFHRFSHVEENISELRWCCIADFSAAFPAYCSNHPAAAGILVAVLLEDFLREALLTVTPAQFRQHSLVGVESGALEREVPVETLLDITSCSPAVVGPEPTPCSLGAGQAKPFPCVAVCGML